MRNPEQSESFGEEAREKGRGLKATKERRNGKTFQIVERWLERGERST